MARRRFQPLPQTSLFDADVPDRARRLGPSFPRFAWALLAFTVYVILGGTLVRATGSGDGCTNHWPDCNGQLLPAFGQLKTVIEFSHRASTGLLTLAILA